MTGSEQALHRDMAVFHIYPHNYLMGAWIAWYKGMGSAVADMGNPAGPSKIIGADGKLRDPGVNPLTGYSIIEAGSMDKAIDLAKGCPIYAAGGSVEVAELIAM